MERQVNEPNRRSTNGAADVIDAFCLRGIRLWSINGQLHYRSSKGRLTPEEFEELRLHKSEIVSFLERTGVQISELTTRAEFNRAPLTFAQLAHWNTHQLRIRPSSCFVCSAIRVRGPLNINALRRSAAELVRRHDVLRTRIRVSDDAPIQEIDKVGNFEISVDDLTALPVTNRELKVKQLIERHALGPINVTMDPLFRIQLLALDEDEHVLLLSMEHIISDGHSMRIMLNELFTAYAQAMRGDSFSLPTIQMQFADFAVRQRYTHNSWLRKHASYWEERVRGCKRLRFPSDKNVPAEAQLGWGSVPFKIKGPLKADLLTWSRKNQTTLVMSVFAAYVALVMRWCNASEAIFQYETDGRFEREIQEAVGFFAFPLYLRIEVFEGDSFVDLLKRLTDEYCMAYEHADFSYMESQVPRPEFTRNTLFNWGPGPATQKQQSLNLGENDIELSQIPMELSRIPSLEIDMEPCVALSETEHEIRGWVQFPLNRFSESTMERFARNIPLFAHALQRQSRQLVKDVELG